jgi:ubiquitin carboxyl-terminal hydrolase L3
MTTLVHKLGLSKQLAFVDVYSLTDPDMLAFVPRPALALLLVFPVSPSYEKFRAEEDAALPEYNKKGDDEDPVWFKQTIRNACGMMGLLHAVANGSARSMIRLCPPFLSPLRFFAQFVRNLTAPPENGSPLAKFLARAQPLSPMERAKALEDSDELEAAHKSAATQGDSAVPNAEDEVELHYVCFVKSNKDNHLYELDGRRKGPLDRGDIGENGDVLSEQATAVVQSFIDREKATGRLDFSLVALTPSFD